MELFQAGKFFKRQAFDWLNWILSSINLSWVPSIAGFHLRKALGGANPLQVPSLEGFPSSWVASFCGFPPLRIPSIAGYLLRKFPPSGVPSFRGSLLQGFPPSRVPSFAGFPPVWVPSFAGFLLRRFPPSRVPSFRGSRFLWVPSFTGFLLCGFPSFQVPSLAGSLLFGFPPSEVPSFAMVLSFTGFPPSQGFLLHRVPSFKKEIHKFQFSMLKSTSFCICCSSMEPKSVDSVQEQLSRASRGGRSRWKSKASSSRLRPPFGLERSAFDFSGVLSAAKKSKATERRRRELRWASALKLTLQQNFEAAGSSRVILQRGSAGVE